MSTPENNLRLDYVEFATRSVVTAQKFYTAAFGWQFTDYGPDLSRRSSFPAAGGSISPIPPASSSPSGASAAPTARRSTKSRFVPTAFAI